MYFRLTNKPRKTLINELSVFNLSIPRIRIEYLVAGYNETDVLNLIRASNHETNITKLGSFEYRAFTVNGMRNCHYSPQYLLGGFKIKKPYVLAFKKTTDDNWTLWQRLQWKNFYHE